jgi:hypothetical protein
VSATSYNEANQPPPLNPELLATELLKQTETTPNNEHLKSAKLYHLSSFIASRSSSVCTAGSLSPISPSIYKSLLDMQDEELNKSKDGGDSEDEKKVIFTIQTGGNENVIKQPLPTVHHQSPPKQNSMETESHPTYGVGQDPNKIREKILSEFLRKRLRKCGLTETFKEIRKV